MNTIIATDYPLTSSYIILTNGTQIDFDLSNTPIIKFSTYFSSKSSLTINGQSVVKKTIKEIYFGDSYNDVTSIGNWFLCGCSSLTSIGFSGLSKVTSIGDYFLAGCKKLTSVDLSQLSNVTSIGDDFLAYCTGLPSIDLSGLSNITSIGSGFLQNCSILTTLIMGAETPPTLEGYAFYQADKLSLILVPCASELAYKSVANWKVKACIIKEYPRVLTVGVCQHSNK